MQPYLWASKDYSENPDISLFKNHTHEYYEIFCFISGDARYFVEGNIYDLKSGDILVIKKAEAHSLLINKCIPYTRYVIHFDAAALLGEGSEALISLIDKKPLGKRNRIPAAVTFENNWLYYLDKTVQSEQLNEKRLYLTVLFNELCQNINKTEYENTSNKTDRRIIDYINKNLMQNITLDEICQHFYLSKTHLNRKFKAMTGSTVWDYIVAKRLIFARDLLLQGQKPTLVSEKCGYSDYSSFYRAYKLRFGVSPKADYRNLK